jgi:hypothetical protein
MRSTLASRELVSVDFALSSGERGRVFLFRDSLPAVRNEFDAAVAREFVEDDDRERLQLMRAAASAATLNFEIYPAESTSEEQHAYVVAPSTSEHPLFACVLATTSVVRELLKETTYVAETAAFQVVGELMTDASIAAGLENWISRVYPDSDLPKLEVERWPQLDVVRNIDLKLGLFGGWSSEPMVDAPEELPQERLLQ